MAIILVTHELKTPLKDYEPLYKALKENSQAWWHYMDVVWIVNSKLTADEFAKKLYPFMTKQDRLLVVRIAREYQGWLPADAWKWINDQDFSSTGDLFR